MRYMLLAFVAAISAIAGPKGTSPTVDAAREFLGALSKEQRARAQFPLRSPERVSWAYVPAARKGVSWGELSTSQRTAATKLLQTVLSPKGYQKAEAIRTLESVLAEMEGDNRERDPNRYWFVFFGEPSDEATWVWRYEGHHLSLTFANRDGAVISSTPQFLGSNPAEVKSGARKGERILAQEQDLAFRLMDSLTVDQRTVAVVSSNAPADIVTGSARKAAIDGRKGLKYTQMSAVQREILKELISAHASVQNDAEQRRRQVQLEKAGYEKLVFAWMGQVSRNGRHYYRIQGESLLIEYDNTQADGNHIHTVWRNLDEDFGGDDLEEHYSKSHSHG